VDVIIDGQSYSLTKQGVEARMRGVEPGRIYQYTAEVNGIRYPIKQPVRVATGLEKVNTDRAHDILRRLGFPIQGPADVTHSLLSTVTEPSPVWILEVQTVAGGVYEIELEQEEEVQALEAELSDRIGSDGSYQGHSRRVGAVGGACTLTIAWKHVVVASLYQRRDRPAA
jgi:hypothetical protein